MSDRRYRPAIPRAAWRGLANVPTRLPLASGETGAGANGVPLLTPIRLWLAVNVAEPL